LSAEALAYDAQPAGPKAKARTTLRRFGAARAGDMIMQWVFLIAAILGAVLPLSFLVPFVAAHGLDVPLILRQLFANDISAFFGVDVIISGLALLVFVVVEGRRRGMRHLWVYVLCTLLVGVSLGLPLFLFARERKLKTAQP
jgi:Protein of unknown function DUF2834